MASIKDMIAALNTNVGGSKELQNTADTWARLKAGDTFDELGMSPADLVDAKKKFYDDNGYENIA